MGLRLHAYFRHLPLLVDEQLFALNIVSRSFRELFAPVSLGASSPAFFCGWTLAVWLGLSHGVGAGRVRVGTCPACSGRVMEHGRKRGARGPHP